MSKISDDEWEAALDRDRRRNRPELNRAVTNHPFCECGCGRKFGGRGGVPVMHHLNYRYVPNTPREFWRIWREDCHNRWHTERQRARQGEPQTRRQRRRRAFMGSQRRLIGVGRVGGETSKPTGEGRNPSPPTYHPGSPT